MRGVASPNMCCSESVRQSSWSWLLSSPAAAASILSLGFMLVVLRAAVRWVKSSRVEEVGLDSRREEDMRDVVEVRAWGLLEYVKGSGSS